MWNGEIFRKVNLIKNWFNPDIDIALVKINAEGLSPAIVGSSINSAIGEEIVAIGDPMGLKSTISEGIISGIRNIGKSMSLIQISAPISPGSSGGPVINKYGEVIGIATLASSSKKYQNLNFAIPIDYIK